MIDYDFEAPAADLFERWLLRRYGSGALTAETRRARLPRVLLARWLVDNAEDLGAPAPALRPGALDDGKARGMLSSPDRSRSMLSLIHI